MKEVVRLLQALADPNRLRALFALERGELCACQLVELLRLAPSTVSQHMGILRRAGLVSAEKRGRWMYYRTAVEEASLPVGRALAFVRACLAEAAPVLRDRRRLAAILAEDPHELCRRRFRRSGSAGPAGAGRDGKRRRR